MRKRDLSSAYLISEIKNQEQKADNNPPYPVDKLTCFDMSLMLFLIDNITQIFIVLGYYMF